MHEFLNHCIASCDVIEGQSKSALEKFVHKIRKKMCHFNDACASGFVASIWKSVSGLVQMRTQRR